MNWIDWLETPRMPTWLRIAVPLIRWRETASPGAVYLTFDDGPSLGITDRLLDILGAHQATATFFVLGESADKHPGLIRRIIDEGHSLGNHSYSHLSGWDTPVAQYLADIDRCDQCLPPPGDRERRRLFRPPFGRLGVVQGLRLLRQRSIVMWDVNSMDYRPEQTAEQIAERVCQFARAGSIVLMHDSPTAGPKTVEALPTILRTMQGRGLRLTGLDG